MSGSIVRTTRTYEVEQLKLLTTCLFKKKKKTKLIKEKRKRSYEQIFNSNLTRREVAR